jgi:integrase
LWTLPPARTKNKRWHEVPIVPAVRKILLSLPRIEGSDFVLTTSGRVHIHDSGMAKRQLDAAITRLNDGVPIAPWVVHDFRRSTVSGMAALKVQVVVGDKVLNHTGGLLRGVAGTYQRYDFATEKKQAFIMGRPSCWRLLTTAAATVKLSQKAELVGRRDPASQKELGD